MREKATHLVEGVKSVTEFLSDAVDAFKDLGFVEAIASALPWAKVAGGTAAGALPPLKFFTRIAAEVLRALEGRMEEHEYVSVRQMLGSMSRTNVADPSAFERANYMKLLASYRAAPS